MKFEDLDEQDKEVLLQKKYSPASELFGDEEIKHWNYYDLYTDAPVKKEILVNGNVHKIPVRGHVYIFRWIMPKRPCIYSLDQEYPDDAIRIGLFRYSAGDAPLQLTEEDIKKIARGETVISPEYLNSVKQKMEKAFKFDTWKIPVAYVSTDEMNFIGAWSMYEGKELERAKELEEKVIFQQEEEKKRLLEDVKGKLKGFPDYLSIVRSLVQEKVSFDEAIEATQGPGIIVKGI